jgi:hypothetical protein
MAKNTTAKNTPISIQTISQIRGQEDFVEFLRTELEWPIPLHIDQLEDVSIPHDLQRDFGFSQAEDRIQVSRLLNLNEDQPWGIFLFEFKTKRPYLSHLRQLLRKLSSRRTLQRGDPIWDRNDLLFICTQDWKEYQFVHFSGERPESAVISSFGWKGSDDRFLHTLCKHNLPRLRMPDPAPDGSISTDDWRSQWRDAFNIKPVTDEFYATLKEVFHAVESGITGLQGEDRRAFTELMINRLIFLKFVEKKSWLNNDRDYLFHHFQKFGGERYWKDFLYHLFFEGLNTDPAQRPAEASRVLGDVPYLNAELFSLSEQWNDSQVEVEGRSLDLLFDKLLNPYNFTVAETSPLEVEVAFNQDLLGYAYEELIADQHGQGAYYTHPTEVNLMCRESLRAYLEERCPQVEKEQIARLVYGELSVTVGGTALAPAQAVDLYSALHDVTICDPAIGSGTFPVAMVKHLFTCMRSLGQILKEYAPFRELIDQAALTDWRKGYELKLHIIERSIYGCDIDYFAVQIAKLRFWIELMVECDQPVSLPNFDFKLLVGDALVSSVGTDRNGAAITLEEMWGHPTKPRGQVNLSADLAKKFAEKKKDYYGVQNPQERIRLRKELLNDRENLILQALQFSRPANHRTEKHVLWQIDFAEIFQGNKPGFDIVIANPPYLRQELIDQAFSSFGLSINKSLLISQYSSLTSKKIDGKSDLYIYFFFRGLMLLRQRSGVECFICSTSWMDDEFGEPLQKFLSTNLSSAVVIENKAKRSFASADINADISIFRTGTPKQSKFISFISIKEDSEINFSDILDIMDDKNTKKTQVANIDSSNLFAFDDMTGKWGARFFRMPESLANLLRIHGNSFEYLGKLSVFEYGNKPGIVDFFILSEERVMEFGIEPEFLKPIVTSTREIECLIVDKTKSLNQLFVCSISKESLKRQGNKGALQYIQWGENQTTQKGASHTVAGVNWPDVKSVSSNSPYWYSIKPKPGGHFIVPALIRERFFYAYNPEEVLDTNMFYHGRLTKDTDREILCALLNSSLVYLFTEVYGRLNIGGRLNLYGVEFKQIPVPNPIYLSSDNKKLIIDQFRKLASTPVNKIEQELQKPERICFDLTILNAFGFDKSISLDDIYLDFINLTNARIARESSEG